MPKRLRPASPLQNAMQLGLMMLEAQAVISMRLMGMAGLWNVSPQENSRMVTEKIDALVQSATDASRVSLRGGSPDEIAAAAIAPVRRATRANSKRLRKNSMTPL